MFVSCYRSGNDIYDMILSLSYQNLNESSNGKYNSSYFFHSTIVRSICPEVFCKKSVLKNFANFTGTQLWESLFFNKIGGLRTCKRSLSDSNALPTTLVHYPNYLKPKLKNLKHHYKQAVA